MSNYIKGGVFVKQRSIGLCIVLSIITCGIYGIYWFIVLTNDTNELSGHSADGTSGGVAFLLTLVTCGIYGFFWCYKMGERINEAKTMRNMPSDSNLGIICLLLSVFGLGIVSYALFQNEINKIETAQV